MAGLIADPFRAARLILSLRKAGVRDNGVLKAIETIDRSAFVEDDLGDLAFEDCTLPIPCGQIMLRPSVVGEMLQALELGQDHAPRALLVGAGSGYLAALLAQLVGHVFAVERYHTLVQTLTTRLERLKISNITVRHGDGLLGWSERGPFDRILLTGAIAAPPPVLLTQLAPGGRIVAPVFTADGVMLCQAEKGGFTRETPLTSAIPALIEGVATVL